MIKPGKVLDADLYYQEANRITKYLREQGYAFFFLNQVSPARIDIADTLDHRVKAFVELLLIQEAAPPDLFGSIRSVFSVHLEVSSHWE